MEGLLYEHPLLGTRGKLGNSAGRPRRYTEEPQVHLGQNDTSSDAILVYLHALRLQGAAPQLASVRLPCHQCHGPDCAGPALPPLSPWREGSVGVNNDLPTISTDPSPENNHGRAMPLQMFTQQQLQQFTGDTQRTMQITQSTRHQWGNCHIQHPHRTAG